ncbi:peptide deformylase [Congregibacter variabilis]|uniref:Peptide deformylase n=1 Tax=Congregibacter variabilis TaxID=3081200 RepID=A0ABZ0I2K3_9GAMM|nr:peptide deformylase [Congregibacter sp. IMCC43200]
MAILDIIEMPDERLREQSAPVTVFDEALQGQVGDLFDTLGETGGIGLSAPQAGISKRIILVNVPDDDYGAQLYINPEVISKSTPRFVEESCLSVPGIEGNVVRATRLKVRAQNLDGESFELDVDGMHAVCVQHELDHLEGVLFIDLLSWFKKLRLKIAAKRNAREAQAA